MESLNIPSIGQTPLADSADAEHQQAETFKRTLHELQVHQLELEMQNKELRRAQVQLELANARYLDLYDQLPVGCCTISESGLIVQANLTAAALLNVSRGALLTRPFNQYLLQTDQDSFYQLRQRLIKTGTTQTCELRMVKSDGTQFWTQLVANIAQDEEGAPALRIVLSDVSERKQTEANLRIAAVTFESQEGTMITDANGLIQQVNLAFTESTGYTADEVVGQTARILHSGRHDDAFYRSMWETIHTTGTWRGEVWDRRKNGEVYPKWLTISAVKDGDGVVHAYIGRHHDMTKRKDTETAMSKLNSELTQSRQSLRKLAALNEAAREEERKHIAREVHDELGQLLSALRMGLLLMEMRFSALHPALNDKVLDMKALVDSAIQGVRNVALKMRPTALDLGLVPALEWLCFEFTKSTNVACTLHAIKEDIVLDATRAVVVFRIVQESLTNITRYARASQVHITLCRRDLELCLQVQDNGEGFDMSNGEHKKTFGLLGMRERALALGGNMAIASTPGRGTVIDVTIPVDLDSTKETS